MPLVSFTVSDETVILIILGLVIPAIVIGVKTYFNTKQNHRCIQRLELLINAAIEERKKEISELKLFFIDWIQRLEDVTRDRRVDERTEISPLRPKSQQQEDVQANKIEEKLDKLIEILSSKTA